jgi:hypothetical protein
MNDDIFKKFGLHHNALEEAAKTLGTHKSIFDGQARLTQQLHPSASLIEEALSARSAAEEMLAASGTASLGDLIAQATPSLSALGAAATMFERPELDAIKTLQRQLSATPYAEIFERYRLGTDVVSSAMDAMHTPWLDIHNQVRSITAFTELHGIGHALATVPSFDDHLTQALRIDLGDWRGPLVMDATALLDATVRKQFYIDRGYDPALIEFPTEALRGGMRSAGLYVPEGAVEEEETVEAGFMRTNEAHDRLMRFEYHLREFIDAKMTKAFGPRWIKQRVPENVRLNWERKRDIDRSAKRQERPLIGYADLTDYPPIILRRDNWADIFEDIFAHGSSVEESFRRLYPVRNCTMHAALLTPDDALFLLVEVKRLGLAFGLTLDP